MGEEIVQVLRIVSYVGPRSVVEEQIKDSLHGIKRWRGLEITAVTIGEFPRIVQEATIDMRHLLNDLSWNLRYLREINPYQEPEDSLEF